MNRAKLLYTVRVKVPNQDVASEYIDWLKSGHVKAIREHASRARIYRVDQGSPSEFLFDSVYEFDDRQAFARYEKEAAPALREEAATKFGPGRGITFERWIEDLVFE